MHLFLVFVLVSFSRSLVQAVLPVYAKGSKFFHYGSNEQFHIKGALYFETTSIEQTSVDVLANATQCALDAPVMQALGMNVVEVIWADASLSHDACMRVFEEHGIYILLRLIPFASATIVQGGLYDANGNPTYADSFLYNEFAYEYCTAGIDAFSAYNNILAYELNWHRTSPNIEYYATNITSCKALIRDLKSYRDATGYRPIPIGFATSSFPDGYSNSENEQRLERQVCEFSMCGPDLGPVPDFISVYTPIQTCDIFVNAYSLPSMADRYKDLNAPIVLKHSCVISSTSDELGRLHEQFVEPFMGAVLYLWYRSGYTEFGTERCFVNYTSSMDLLLDGNIQEPLFPRGSPIPQPNIYNGISEGWGSMDVQTVYADVYSTSSRPACSTPTTLPLSSGLSLVLDPRSLPTLAAVVIPTPTSTWVYTPSSDSTDNSSADSSPDEELSSSGLSSGSIAGIVVGAVVGIAGFVGAAWFYLRRRRGNTGLLPAMKHDESHQKAEMYAGPINTAFSGPVTPKPELDTAGVSTTRNTPSELYPSPEPLPTDNRNFELHSDHLIEVESNSRADLSSSINPLPIPPQLKQQQQLLRLPRLNPAPATGELFARVSAAHTQPSLTPTTTSITSANNRDEELIEEADLAVQELGLVSTRKRALATQAQLQSQRPEDVEGRKGDEYRRLVEQESEIRMRLEEIQQLRDKSEEAK